MHALAGGLDPAHQRCVVGELLDDRAIGGRDVRGVAGQRDPPERTFALAEQRPDVRGHEARIVEGPLVTAQLCLGAQAVAVVENLRAAIEERDHPLDVARHAFPRATYIRVGLVEPQLLRVVGAEARGDVAERIVRRRLVGDDVDVELAPRQRRQHLGRVAVQPDGKRLALLLRVRRELQRVL